MSRVAIILLLAASAGFVVAAEQEQPAYVYPKIQGQGKVVQLSKAAAQPRDGDKICVDLTAEGAADQVNPGLAKVARFVNIYAGAGARPATVRITVVLHGKATDLALTESAYAQRHKTKTNPNLPLLRQLREAGVEILVCGQAAASHGIADDQIAKEVTIAVSALTVNVQRQLQGYAYIPLH